MYWIRIALVALVACAVLADEEVVNVSPAVPAGWWTWDFMAEEFGGDVGGQTAVSVPNYWGYAATVVGLQGDILTEEGYISPTNSGHVIYFEWDGDYWWTEFRYWLWDEGEWVFRSAPGTWVLGTNVDCGQWWRVGGSSASRVLVPRPVIARAGFDPLMSWFLGFVFVFLVVSWGFRLRR